MDPITIGAAIAGAASLAGGFLGSSDKKVAEGHAQDQAANNMRIQMIMAQHGVTMRANDIMNAYNQTGIHPLALTGVQGPTYTPTAFVGGSNSPMGDAISSAGQGIGRAVMATGTERERMAHQGRMDALLMERANLENTILRQRIASENVQLMQNNNPSMPIGNRTLVPGQGNSPLVKLKPMEVTRTAPGSPSNEPGGNPAQGFLDTATGYMPVRGKSATEQLEDDWIGNVWWNVPHRFLPAIAGRAAYRPPTHVPLKPGHRWYFDGMDGEYRQVPIRRSDGWDPSAPYRQPFGGRR